MEKSMHIEFEVASEKMSEAKTIIQTFISNIRAHEPGTRMYTSLQDAARPTRFVHVMIFQDEEAQLQHRNSAYVKEFTQKLYPICVVTPVFTEMNHILSK